MLSPRASKYKASAHMAEPGSDRSQTLQASGLTLEEAAKILNVPVPQRVSARSGSRNAGVSFGDTGAGEGNGPISTDMDYVMERFKRLFDQNDPKRGGSFYLQSKILRARERIEMEVRNAEQDAEDEQMIREGGWNPKMYKD